MRIETRIIFDSGNENYVFSLEKQDYLILDTGTEQKIGEPTRMAVTPLDIDKVTEFTASTKGIGKARATAKVHPIVDILSTLWTDEVKAAYKAKCMKAEEEEQD